MTSSSSTVTTEDGGRQNMFAAEPRIEVIDQPYWPHAELTNGRMAMIGFFALVHNYILFGAVIPGIFYTQRSLTPPANAGHFLTLLQI